MSLPEQINEQLKTAMKEKDQLKMDTLRQIKTAIKNTEIKKGKTLTDAEVQEVVFSLLKSHTESIEVFKNNNRPEMAEKEEKELVILKQFLPQQLTDAEVTVLVQEAIKESGVTSVKEMGKLMGKLMPKVKGKADGAKVNAIVKSLLPG
ncbi:MAG: GatB/YqeY domain-containing protein [bacterium]